MPDTAEAVAQYGSAVYRLAYAMTRSRATPTTCFRRFFSGSTGPLRILRMRNTDVRGSCG